MTPDCCCAGPTDNVASAFACVACQTRGSPVKDSTVKALLSETALKRFEPGAHRFCPDASCDVVYFDTEGRTFTTADLHVPVWQKQPPGARTICYCFGENEADVRAEIEHAGRSNAEARVRDHIRAGRCACELRNPKGACCLADVTQAVKRMAHG